MIPLQDPLVFKQIHGTDVRHNIYKYIHNILYNFRVFVSCGRFFCVTLRMLWRKVQALLHGAINCINTQLKSTKRAIDCSPLKFLFSQHVHKFIAQPSNLSQRCQRHESLWAENVCRTCLVRASLDSHHYAIARCYIAKYSNIVLINLDRTFFHIKKRRESEPHDGA